MVAIFIIDHFSSLIIKKQKEANLIALYTKLFFMADLRCIFSNAIV